MNRQELRGWLAARLNRDETPRALWDVLEYRGHVHDVLEGELTLESLEILAKALALYNDVLEDLEVAHEQDKGGRQIEPPRFAEHEVERAKALDEYLALRAAGDPGVRWFRKDMLAGEALTPEKAHEYVRRLEVSGISMDMIGENSRDYDGSAGNRLEFFAHTGEGRDHLEFRAGSALEQLHDLCDDLIERVSPPWDQAEAAWFVLTGEAPVHEALAARVKSFVSNHLTYSVVTIQVEPWIAADTVSRTYQYLQAQLLHRKPRALSARNTRVARFVFNELRQLAWGEAELRSRLSWRELMERWNRATQQESYADERLFNRDFYRAARPLVHPFETGPTTAWSPEDSITVSMPNKASRGK